MTLFLWILVARTCNLILIVLDVLKPLGHKKIIENELEGFGIRLNSKPPNIGFKKKDKGGINLTATVSWKFSLTKKIWKRPLQYAWDHSCAMTSLEDELLCCAIVSDLSWGPSLPVLGV